MPLLLSGQGVGGVGTPPPAASPAAPPAAPPELKPEDLCTVEGQIFNASTAEPVRKATIRMMRADFVPSPTSGQPPTYTTSTDAAGRFAMKDIDPGKYRLTVDRTGFVSTQYGARGSLRPGTILTLDRGKKITDIVFRLTPHAVVTGRVVDEDGDPVANSQVQLARTSYAQGKKQLSYANGAQTNDLGEYRIFGVAPGKYYLAVTYRPSVYMMNAVDRSAAALSDEEYVPTYHPGTTDLSAAAQIDVPAGGQLPNMSMKLVKVHTMRVRGHVSQTAISGRANISLMLFPRSNDSMNMMMAMNRSRPPDAKGNFELTGIAPGSYFLRASVNSGEKGYSVRVPVDVGNTNVEGLNVTITPGIPLTGKVLVESDTPQDLTDTRVLLRPRDTTVFFSMGNAIVRADGTFKVDDISPDQYTLSLFGLPDGFYVKTVRLGQTEVPPSNVDVSSGAPEPLSIVVSPKAGQITGAVQNSKTQQSMPGASVVLIPQAKERKDDFSFYKTITTDQFGNFTFKNLPPGDYKVFAWEDLEPGAYYDPEFVKPVESNGEKVTVTESGKHAVQVTMIPADAPAQNERGNSRQN